MLAGVTSYRQVSFLSSLVGQVGGVIYLNSGNIQVEALGLDQVWDKNGLF